MDAATLQNRIYKGYGKAALRLGIQYDIARPIYPQAPLGNVIGNLLASFNAEDWKYSRPNKYGKPTWFGLFDGTVTQAGDYLVGAQSTYFIAAQQLHLPILCVECNRQVSLLSMPSGPSSVGAQGYGGVCAAESISVLGDVDSYQCLVTGWPASVLFGGRQTHGTDLPLSVNNTGFQIILPRSVPETINASDIFVDDLGRRYQVEGAELTDLGWRANVKEVHA
jgi:hypothetical protein